MGTCITVDRGLNGDYLGCFLRIRVNLPINELLKRCVTLRLAWMNLQNNMKLSMNDSHFSFFFFLGKLHHVGTNCALKSGRLEVEQYGKWKTAVKEVYSIFVENGMKGRRFGFGDDNSSSMVRPQGVQFRA